MRIKIVANAYTAYNMNYIADNMNCIDTKAVQLVTPCNKDLCDIKRSRCKQNGGDFWYVYKAIETDAHSNMCCEVGMYARFIMFINGGHFCYLIPLSWPSKFLRFVC